MSLKFGLGDKASSFNFDTPWKKDLSFFTEIENKYSVLIFLRYIGCPVCQVEMANIKRNIEYANRKKALVFIVLQSSVEIIESLTTENDWPFTIICDPKGEIFRKYHVFEGTLLNYMNPIGIIATVKALFSGKKHGKFEGNEKQLPAAFIIDHEKRILFAYYGKYISDIPKIEELMSYINELI